MSAFCCLNNCLNKLYIKKHFILKSFILFKMPYYAVAKGRKIGIYNSWPECETQVKGYGGAKYKKFNTEQEAKSFISTNSMIISNKPKTNLKKTVVENVHSSHFSSSSSKNDAKKNDKLTEIINIDDSENDEVFDLDDEKINQIMDKLENDVEYKKLNPVSKKNTCTKERNIILLNEIPEKYSCLKRPLEENSEGSKKKIKIGNSSKTHEFSVDANEYVVVYTDGSCTNNGKRAAKAGLGVYFGENHHLNVSSPVSGRATNNCGEIQAATKAIQIAHSMGIKKLAIKTDSKFVINAATKWMSGWKRKGWILASGEPVKNKIDFMELDNVSKLLDVKWVYVEAHKGIMGNERADQLAKEGASQYKS